MVVLPALGGETIRPRWPLPRGLMMSMTRAERLVGSGLQPQALVGEQRRERVEGGAVPRLLGIHAVDRLDLEQGVVLLVVTRGAHLAGDLVAPAQLEAPDLRQRHVDVGVGLGVALGAQEAVAIGEDVEQPGAEMQAPVLGLLVQDLHDEILLGVLAEVLDAQLARDHVQVGEQLGLDLG